MVKNHAPPKQSNQIITMTSRNIILNFPKNLPYNFENNNILHKILTLTH